MTLPPALAAAPASQSSENELNLPACRTGAVHSPMPALPAECLERVLRASIEGLSPSSRYRVLRSACLVRRNWLLPAQSLLHRDVVIHSQSSAKLWIASPASQRFVAERIELDGRYGQVDAYAAESVLIKAKLGLKRLRIDFVRGLSSRAFVLPNLASCTHLTLHSKILCDGEPLLIHFQLSRLVIGGSYFPLACVKALFAASINSLIDLTVTMQAGHSPPLRAELNTSISTLANLRTISDWTRNTPDFLELVPYLPPSVETINTCWPERNRLFALAQALAAPGSLPRLANVRLVYIPRDAVIGNADGTQIVAVCQKRNIELSFGFEKDYLREEHLLCSTDALKIYY